ncbi:hypothetical protein BDZ45DRAFT_679913 [Acephala macrosclerotiorum]|nr:hypothetical protein BDZ45DRAFT_679913 [Acephala macrosclerotiorum]
MSQAPNASDARHPQRTGSKRRRDSSTSDSLDASYKRAKQVDLTQESDNSNFKASSQSESQLDNITESPSNSSGAEDTSFTSDTSLTSLSRCSSYNPTHDTSRTSFHIKDLATFATTLEEAAKGAFPNRGRSRYAKVNACLIRWAEDETVQPELERLYDVFKHGYGFEVEDWTIPTINSHRKLMGKALDFIEEFDARDNLFVVYYAGHGTINENRQSVWCCTRDPKYASVDWSSIQSLFDDALSDVLILLDCCAAASSINTSGNGVNETIAACGFEGIAPPPGRHSFTNTLIEVLEDWKDRVHISVSLLHSEVLFQLKRKRPEKGQQGTRIPGWCSTPVHYISSSDPRPQSIELSRIQVSAEDTVMDLSPYPPQPLNTGLPESIPQDEQISSLTSISPTGTMTVPHVLISVALEEEQADLNLECCRLWLTRFPAFVKYAKVQAVFKSQSTLLLLSLPIAIWNMLPDNKACSFIGFITSKNLACTVDIADDETSAQAVSNASPIKPIAPSSLSDPILDWYSTNDGPWSNIVPDKFGEIAKSSSSTHAAHANPFRAYEYAGTHYGVPYSDSGYGSRRSVADTSVFGHAEADRDYYPVSHETTDYQSFIEQRPWSPSASSKPDVGALVCPICNKVLKTVSELKKHELRHTEPFKCTVPACMRTEGFSTPNDLNRHMKSRHPLEQLKKREEFCETPFLSSDTRTKFDANKSMEQTEFKIQELVGESSGVQEISKVDSNQLSGKDVTESSMQSDPVAKPTCSAPVHAGPVNNDRSAASSRSENQVTCKICKKFTGRPCKLKKHMKRHEQPYGCTFLSCNKVFGSKNDWKRHENSQHFHLELWKCDEQRPDGEGICVKLCYRRQAFHDHLVKDHNISDDNIIKSKLDNCRIGRNVQTRFWCGFCAKLIDLKKKSVEAFKERLDHIDNHFMGRMGVAKMSIAEWVPVDSDKPKGASESSNMFSDSLNIRSRSQTPCSSAASDHGSWTQSP